MELVLQSEGKRNLSKHLNATEAALAEKIRSCQDAKAQLDKAILDVDLELQYLTRTSAKLQKLLARRRAALDLSEKRLKVISLWFDVTVYIVYSFTPPLIR